MLRRLRLPMLSSALALSSLAVGVGGTTAGASTEDEGAILQLTAGAEVGQSVEQDIVMTIELSAGGEEFDVELGLSLGVEIVAVEDDGGYRTETVITDVEHLGGAPQGAQVVQQLEPVIGVAMTVDVAADGTPGEVEFDDTAPAGAKALMEEFGANLSGPPLRFPEGPVAVGDTWTDEVDITSSGMSLPIDITYELVALDDDTYTVDLEYEGELEESGVTAVMTASGTTTGSRTSPLLLDSEMESHSDIDGDGLSMSQRFNVVLDSEPAED